jgi:hypothetical protein
LQFIISWNIWVVHVQEIKKNKCFLYIEQWLKKLKWIVEWKMGNYNAENSNS